MESNLIKAIAVTAELTGTEMSDAAARIFAEDLSLYPLRSVLTALTRCRRELKGRLTLIDVINRIVDGRPGVEEAWSMFPKSESDSVVWTDEMREASGAAASLLYEGDRIGARMAFKERYLIELQKARSDGVPVTWTLSAGHDSAGRVAAVREAEAHGRIAPTEARAMLAQHCPDADMVAAPRLSGPMSIKVLLPGKKIEGVSRPLTQVSAGKGTESCDPVKLT